MDDTKKTLLSIDLDTDALIKNAKTAKDAIADLTNQLNALKAAGQANTPVFAALSGQLKTTTIDYKNAAKAIADYTKALGDKTKAEQDNIKEAPTPVLTPVPVLGAKQTSAINNELVAKPTNKDLNINFDAERAKKAHDDQLAADKKTHTDRLQALTDYNDKVKKIGDNALDFQKKLINQELRALDTKNKSYQDSAIVIAGVYDKTTVLGKAAVLAKIGFGAAEIAINTEQQISNIILGTEAAVAQDWKMPIPVNAVLAAIDIAGGITRATSAALNGAQQIKKLYSVPVGKARGGIFESDGLGAYLTGPGSGTSDSINARLSNGESVINARSTQMFAPLLSAINQAGGGVAFNINSTGGAYATGGLFNGSNTLNDSSTDLATARATTDMMRTIAANMPRQVLVVEDVQASLQNKVMLQNMSNF